MADLETCATPVAMHERIAAGSERSWQSVHAVSHVSAINLSYRPCCRWVELGTCAQRRSCSTQGVTASWPLLTRSARLACSTQLDGSALLLRPGSKQASTLAEEQARGGAPGQDSHPGGSRRTPPPCVPRPALSRSAQRPRCSAPSPSCCPRPSAPSSCVLYQWALSAKEGPGECHSLGISAQWPHWCGGVDLTASPGQR